MGFGDIVKRFLAGLKVGFSVGGRSEDKMEGGFAILHKSIRLTLSVYLRCLGRGSYCNTIWRRKNLKIEN